MKTRGCLAPLLLFLILALDHVRAVQPPSVARLWNEELLAAIRRDFSRPPIHARNLYHVSVVMWDCWAVYDPVALGVITTEKIEPAGDRESARAESISFGAYRMIAHRFAASPGSATTMAAINALMSALGYDPANTSTSGDTPPEVGNRIAAAMISFGFADGSNEQANYVPPGGYAPVNSPLIVSLPGNPEMTNPNRWQEMTLTYFVDQNGNPIPTGYPPFVCPHWDAVVPFSLRMEDHSPPGGVMNLGIYLDPGPPPLLGTATDEEYKDGFVVNVEMSSRLTPDDGVMIDISPRAMGNNPLGTNVGTGYPVNPATGQPYAPNIVPRGDFGRVVAEFWADGPNSETPPGHWNVLANEVTDTLAERRIGGTGPILSDLEWDVKLYLALNGAVHDAAIACWGAKGYYDYVRPISAIRYMCDHGQSSDSGLPNYHPEGIPLVPGLIEPITTESSAPGERHAELAGHVGQIAVYSWPGEPEDRTTQYSGVKWILGSNWITYQLKTFITPPFAGYYSGHSTYSRSAAEIMARFTGSAFFPGGMGEFVAHQNDFLNFELGPSVTVRLQWATYYDAADQAGLSRLYGGIHPPIDDFTGRIQGSMIGTRAWYRALGFFDPEHNSARTWPAYE